MHLECGEHECPSVEVQPISKVKNWIACEKILHRQEMNEEHPKKAMIPIPQARASCFLRSAREETVMMAANGSASSRMKSANMPDTHEIVFHPLPCAVSEMKMRIPAHNSWMI